MTETFCELEEISLVNIITLNEAKLQRNFQTILSRLDSLGHRFGKLQQRMALCQQTTSDSVSKFTHQLSKTEQCVRQYATCQTDFSSTLSSLQQQLKAQELTHEQRLNQLHDKVEQTTSMMASESSRLKDEIQQIQIEERKVKDTMSLQVEKAEGEMERVKKELGSLVVKGEHMSKKIKNTEEKVEKIEVEVTTSQAGTQKLVQDMAVRFVEEIKSGFMGGDSAGGSGAGGKGQSILAELANHAANGSHIGQLGQLLPGLKDRLLTRTEDPNGLARSITELRERLESQETNVTRSLNKFSETLNRELNEFRGLRVELRRETGKEKSQPNSNYIMEKIQELRPELNKLSSRIDTVEDKSSFVERKLDETRRSLVQLTTFAKQNSLNRYDQKIKTLQTEFFSQLRQLTTRVDGKTQSTEFIRNCLSTQAKIRELHEFLSTKCEKLEVKKALLFIQSKIKEIILVISEDEENQKDALLTKKNVKCISCDKELDKYAGLVSGEAKNWNMLPTKDLQSEHLGRFGINKFGSLAKKLKRLEGGELPLLRTKKDSMDMSHS